MDGVDPITLLEWLQTGSGDERDLQASYPMPGNWHSHLRLSNPLLTLQLMALEQLCMLLLMSDNIGIFHNFTDAAV